MRLSCKGSAVIRNVIEFAKCSDGGEVFFLYFQMLEVKGGEDNPSSCIILIDLSRKRKSKTRRLNLWRAHFN